MTETIQINMTWRSAAGIFRAVLEGGSPDGKAAIWPELARMADTADRARELAELVAAIREELRTVVETHKVDPKYVTRADMAATIQSAFDLAIGETKTPARP